MRASTRQTRRSEPGDDTEPSIEAKVNLGGVAPRRSSNTEAVDWFGHSVALSLDGTRLAVGAYGEVPGGATYVLSRTGTTWTQEAYIKASNAGGSDYFGHSVALSLDGTRLAVGAPNEDSSATGVGGNQADNTAMNSGAAYVF